MTTSETLPCRDSQVQATALVSAQAKPQYHNTSRSLVFGRNLSVLHIHVYHSATSASLESGEEGLSRGGGCNGQPMPGSVPGGAPIMSRPSLVARSAVPEHI
jgi:hypothetical protein